MDTIDEVVRKLKKLDKECPHCGSTKMEPLDKIVLAVLVIGPLCMLVGAIVDAWK